MCRARTRQRAYDIFLRSFSAAVYFPLQTGWKTCASASFQVLNQGSAELFPRLSWRSLCQYLPGIYTFQIWGLPCLVFVFHLFLSELFTHITFYHINNRFRGQVSVRHVIDQYRRSLMTPPDAVCLEQREHPVRGGLTNLDLKYILRELIISFLPFIEHVIVLQTLIYFFLWVSKEMCKKKRSRINFSCRDSSSVATSTLPHQSGSYISWL